MSIVQALISISPLYLWTGLFIVLVVFVCISAILMYHWKKYGLRRQKIKVVQRIYFVGSIILLSIAIIALSFYTLW